MLSLACPTHEFRCHRTHIKCNDHLTIVLQRQWNQTVKICEISARPFVFTTRCEATIWIWWSVTSNLLVRTNIEQSCWLVFWGGGKSLTARMILKNICFCSEIARCINWVFLHKRCSRQPCARRMFGEACPHVHPKAYTTYPPTQLCMFDHPALTI